MRAEPTRLSDFWPALWFVLLVVVVTAGLALCMVHCDYDRDYEPAAQSEFTR